MAIRFFIQRCLAFLLDFGLISLLTQGILFFLSNLDIVYPPYASFLITSLLMLAYSLLSACNQGKSAGREWMRITAQKTKYSKIRWLLHDFIGQWGIGYIIPLGVFHLFHYYPVSTFILLLLFGLANLISWFICRCTLADLFFHIRLIKKEAVGKKSGKKFYLINVNLVNYSIIFAISTVLNRLLLPRVFIENMILVWIVGLVYTCFCYLFCRATVGEILFGYRLMSKNGSEASLSQRIKRELLYKMGLGYILPALLLFLFGWDDIYFISLWVACIQFYIWIAYYSIHDEHWADTMAQTQKVLLPSESARKITFLYLGLLLFWGVSVTYITYWSSQGMLKSRKGDYPFQFVEYPENAVTLQYSQFLAEKGQDPKDYILDLFEENDIVILCENWHLEDRQWEFFSSVVSDPRFISKVGNVFTEYGWAKDQYKVDRFLNTHYANDTLLEKATATLMNYRGANFFYFMKNLNLLNQNLPDSAKVKGYFTDILAYKYLFTSYKDPLYTYDNNPLWPYRDSLMAQVVIDWYKTHRKKCLFICNNTTAFMLNPQVNKEKLSLGGKQILKKAAQYIQNACPGKTANVLLYRTSYKRYFWQPIHNGKWRTALGLNHFKPVGFAMEGSPFGNDTFDLLKSGGRRTQLTYQDVFTGFVFYKPEEEYTFHRTRYGRYAAEQEYQWAKENQLIYEERIPYDLRRYVDIFDNSEMNIWLIHYFNYYWEMFLLALIIIIAFIRTQ